MKIDNVTPCKRWEFDDEVASCFANMLERSIPDYRSMRSLVQKIGERFVTPHSLIVDIGCSTGLAVEGFIEKYKKENSFLLVDNSRPMVETCLEKYRGIDCVSVVHGDIWEHLPLKMPEASLILSILALQFMPTAYRQQIINEIYNSLTPNGCFILVEKIVSETQDSLMVDLYYEMKRENGYSDEQISRKKHSLENVLSPNKADWNVDMLKTAGFEKVDMFWRCLNFCGWIAVK